jgi:DNA repair protein SbcD/Mre11
MRLLHTGDWHVGKSLRGRSRLDESAAVLEEIVGIAMAEGVDGLLLAGDVYEHQAAAPEADAIVFETLVRLHAAGVRVVVIPGNHDSAMRFEALGKLLAPIGVTVVPRVLPPAKGGVVELASRDGADAALIACVPFVPERRFGDAAALFDASESWYQSYARGMGELLDAMRAGFRRDRVNVLLAHLFTDGALLGGGERELTIGLAYAIPPGRLPGTAHYIALGHVHRPQPVRGAPAPARFAGSPLQLDFGERDQTKSVTIVDASPGTPALVREVPLSAGRRLVDVRGRLDEILASAGDHGDALLRVFVSTDGPVPGIAERVREALPNALDVHLVYERAAPEAPDAEPVASLAPREQFLAYFRAQHGADPAERLLEAFDEILAAELEGA